MTVFDWLATVQGRDALFVLILLVQAVTAWVAMRTKQQSETNNKLLNGHIQAHVDQVFADSSNEPGHQVDAPRDTPA